MKLAGGILALVAAVCVVTVSAQPPPDRCCIKTPQYRVSMTELSSINSNKIQVSEMAADHDRQMQVMNMSYFDPNTRTSAFQSLNIIDFKTGNLYTVMATDPSKCYKTPYPASQVKCIPEDAQYLGSTYLGPLAGSLQYDGWRFTLPKSNIKVTIAMTKESCVPVVEGVATEQGNQLYLFTTFVPKIDDPERWFTLPAACKDL